MSKKVSYRKYTKSFGKEDERRQLDETLDILKNQVDNLTSSVNTITSRGDADTYKGTPGDIKINKIAQNRYEFYIRGEDGWHKDNNASFGPIDEDKDLSDPPTVNMTSGQFNYGYEGNTRLTLNLDPTKVSTASIATPTIKGWGHLQLDSTQSLILNPTTEVKSETPIKIKETSAAVSDTADYGQLWVKDETEQELYFTTDDGVDIQLTHKDHLAPTEQTRIQVRNNEGSTIPAGAPLYSKGEIGGSERILVGICDANDANKMPCIGIAYEEMNTSSTKDNYAVVSGVYNKNISGFPGVTEGDVVYVSDTAGLTINKPIAPDCLIQNIGIVIRANTPAGQIQGILVSAIGRTNDIPNELVVNYIANATTDTDKFLVSDSGTVKYRTGAEMLSDLGISADEIIDWTVDQGSTNIHANNIEITHNQVTDFDSEVNALAQVKIDALIDSAPAALDTLNELAAALGDDANFATTVTNSLALKAPLAAPAFTGNATFAGVTDFNDRVDINETSFPQLTFSDDGGTDKMNMGQSGEIFYFKTSDTANDIRFRRSDNEDLLNLDMSALRVGIGVTDPDSRLEIVGAGNDNTTYGLSVKDSGDTNLFYVRDDGVVSVLGGYFFAQHSSGAYFTGSIKARGGITDDGGALGLGGNGNTDDMTISSGNVGIGTTSPDVDLDIRGTNPSIILADDSPSDNKFIAFNIDVPSDDVHTISVDQADSLAFGEKLEANDTSLENEWVRITNAGNVGIGTTSPSAKLDVAGDTNITGDLTVSSSSDPSVIIQDPNGSGLLRLLRTDTSKRFDISLEGNDLRFTPNTTDGSMNVLIGVNAGSSTIDSRLGVGNATPSEMLDVTGNAKISGTLEAGATTISALEVGDSTEGIKISALSSNIAGIEGMDTGSSAWNSIHIKADGNDGLFIEKDTNNVGIGTTSPTEMLHLQSTGDVKILLEADTDNSVEDDNPEILFSQDGGGVTGVIGFTSDNKLKIANSWTSDTGDILLQTKNITRATIYGSGSTRFHNTTQFYNGFPQIKLSDDSGADFVEIGLNGNVFINKTSDADINFLWRDNSNNDLLSIDTGAQTVTIGETTQQTYKLKIGDNGRMNMPVRGLEFENGHGYWNALGEFGLVYLLMSTQNDLIRHRTPLTLERWNGSAWVDELSGTTSENNPTTNLQGLKNTLDGSKTTGWTLDDEWKKFRFVITREQAWAEEQLIYLDLGWSSTNFSNGSSTSGSMCPTMTVEQLDGSFDAVDDNNNDWTTNTTITSDWHTTGIASQYGTFFTFSNATHMPETHVRITVEFPDWDASAGGSKRMNIRNLGMLSNYASDRTTEVWTTNWDRDAIGYGNTKIPAGHSYFINNVSVLNTNTLGSGVVNSSLTSVGTLTSLAVSGNTNIDGNLAIGDVNNASVSLHIKEDSVNARIRVQSTGSNSTSYMRLENDAQNWDIRVDGGNSDKFIIRDETASTNRFSMDTSGNIVTTGNMSPAGYLQLTGAPSDPGADGTVRLGQETNVLKIFSNYGWVRLGAESASWAHIRTDRSQFYFSTNIVVDGGYVSSYDEDLILRRDYNDTTYNQITIGDDTLDIKLDNTSRLAIDGNGQVDLTGDLVLRGEKGIFIENLGGPTGTSTGYGGSIIQPATAMFRTATNTHTGFIKIVIPTSTGANPRDMFTFWVDVFDYASGDSFSVYISGYNYEDAGSNEWHNCDAMILGTESHRDFTVRFCHDGTNPCITIGETDTTWNYLQVTVRNVQVGFTADIDDFKGDWTISVETTLPTYVDETVSGNFPIASRTIGTADIATTVTLTDQGSDSTCFPVFSTANTGDRNLHTDSSALTYNSTNGTLTSTTVSGTYLEATSKLNITTSSDAVATFKMTDDAWGYMEWRKNNNDRVAYFGMDSDMDRMIISATENGANELEINTTTVDINADVDISGTLDMEENNINNVGEIALDKIKADTASNVNIMFNTSGMTFNVETGDSYQFNLGEVDADLVYYDDEENDLFKIDSGNKRVGIGLSAPTTTLDVEGTVSYKHVAVTASSDAVDVSGATVVECTPSGNISIGGFSGGVQGQVIHVLKVDSGFGRVFLEHNESTGTQKIFTSAATDIAIIQKGGVTLYCTGSEWIVLDK